MQPKTFYLFFTTLTIAISGLFFNSTLAQSPTPQVAGPSNIPIFITLNPALPKPYSSVTATLSSYSTDLNKADISWFINGSLEKREVGLKSFNFKSGLSGQKTDVSVSVLTQEGFILEQNTSFTPAEVSLYWEGDTFTPPFYKGKALYSHQSTLRVIAIPELRNSAGQTEDPDKLIYTWKKDGEIVPGASGVGKRVLNINTNTLIRSFSISVTVTSATSDSTAEASSRFASIEPSIMIYKQSPIYGIDFDNEVGLTFDLNEAEISFVAMPFFFSSKNPGFPLNYSWRLNNSPISSGEKTYMVTFRNTENQSGFATISTKVENSNSFMQFGSNDFRLNFKSTNKQDGSIF